MSEDIPTSPTEQPTVEAQPGNGAAERIQELERLVRGLEAYAEELRTENYLLRADRAERDNFEDLSALQEQFLNPVVKKLEKIAFHDEQTGLLSRRGFLEKAESVVSHEERLRTLEASDGYERRADVKPVSLSFIMLDLDHFKAINDKYGHVTGGDVVLKHLGNTIRECIREEDFAGRMGGEEFAILVPSPDPNVARQVADRMRMAIEKMVVNIDGTKVPVTASLGIATWAEGESSEQTLTRADRALYRAKNGGRNQVAADFSPEASQ